MSRNNLILVAEDKRYTRTYYYVIVINDADADAKEIAIKTIRKKPKRTSSRAVALVLAHDIQKKIRTEYGVVEETLI